MKLNWLYEVEPVEVSYVDNPAIDRKFYAIKMVGVKGALPFVASKPLPEATSWDAGAQVKKAEVEDLKKMCAWFDSAAPDKKGSYKLPHHICESGYPVVWNGVKAAMGALKGARGGVILPSDAKKSVYNHLVKHYKQWDKEPPEFKSLIEEEIDESLLERVKNKIFGSLGILDTKIGRVLSKSNEDRLLEATNSINIAVKIIKNILKTVNKNVKEEEMEEKEIIALIDKTISEKFGIFEKSIDAKLEKLLFEKPGIVEPKVEVKPENETEEEKKIREEKEAKEKIAKEEETKGSLLTRITEVVGEKFKGMETEIKKIKEELNIKPEPDRKKVNKKEFEPEEDDKEVSFENVFGLKNINL